ncbi:DUF655 domain-containing protein [Bordetella sp. N]|uniref:ComEA family DNA-binding protein n=1 Tax=Bordetella sp. N TaxID=1746199 RepID=UPI0009E718A6|nr:DUF655 domain-containing protein [Bordetella sp. N]
MNPFVHNPVASAYPLAGAASRTGRAVHTAAPAAAASIALAAAARQPSADMGRRARRAVRAGRRDLRHWGRRLGMLALAAGMSLAAASAAALDVNSATAEQLQTLRGVGPKTAAIIIKERQRGGNFQSLEDLSDRVRGIGAKKARALQEAGLSIGGGAADATAGKADAPAGPQAGPKGEPAKPGTGPGRPGSRRGGGRS